MSLLTDRQVTRVVTLREYETSDHPVTLDAAAVTVLRSLPSGRLEISPSDEPGAFFLRATSWVGAVVLPQLTIHVLPKVKDLRTVLTMFTSGTGLVDWRTDTTTYRPSDLVDGVAELALRAINAATRRGLVHGYRAAQERVPVIRGRLDVQQLAARPWDAWPVPCRFDDFTPDVSENRVLLAAVRQIARWPVGPVLRRMASELLQRLQGVGDSSAALAECDLIQHTPANEHYQPSLALARLVLEGFGLTQAVGGLSAQTFLVDMNKLFEKWIGDELSARLWPSLQVVEQSHVRLSISPRVTMTPDLVFRRGKATVFVADVKYKLTGGGLARTDDYYQLLAYTTAMRLPRGLLIYCRADTAPERVIRVVGGDQRLHTHPVDLSGSPSSVTRALDALAASIFRLVALGPAGDGADR
jgi:5-methylcytosine-specific restriction enzyme subunit McrC